MVWAANTSRSSVVLGGTCHVLHAEGQEEGTGEMSNSLEMKGQVNRVTKL